MTASSTVPEAVPSGTGSRAHPNPCPHGVKTRLPAVAVGRLGTGTGGGAAGLPEQAVSRASSPATSPGRTRRRRWGARPLGRATRSSCPRVPPPTAGNAVTMTEPRSDAPADTAPAGPTDTDAPTPPDGAREPEDSPQRRLVADVRAYEVDPPAPDRDDA